jgi:hypothetical protein
MTPKEKAEELIAKMTRPINDDYYVDYNDYAKECALIAVDYVIIGIYQIDHKHTAVYDNKGTFYNYKECQELKYWQEVKKEIEAL